MPKEKRADSRRRGLVHVGDMALPVISDTTINEAYREWYRRTVELVGHPDLTFDIWLSIRDEVEGVLALHRNLRLREP